MADGVQIYGAFDVGVVARGGSDNGVTTGEGTSFNVASGMNGHNGIGFRMSEDLGNGMKISGDAMFGFALDAGAPGAANQSGNFSNIYSYLALSGDFGTVIAGRAGGARAGFIKKYDPFGGFGVGGALAVQNSGADYADNVLAWVTPEVMPGLKGLFAYTSNLIGQDQQARGAGSTPLYVAAALYNSGPLDVTVSYEKLYLYGGAENSHVQTIGASYDFGMVKLMGLWQHLTNIDQGYQIGLTAPVGEATTLKVGYVQGELKGVGAQNECKKFAVGVNHDLSKRTRLYVDAARLSSDDNSTCAAQGGLTTGSGLYSSSGAGRDNSVGYGEWGVGAGVRHSF
ncbi:MAG: porin [Burkholderiales bacterium]|nr:porin [Burkholderiales bacterium]